MLHRWRARIGGLFRPQAWLALLMPRALRSLTIQASLLLGFILIFALLLISGYSLLRRMSEVETRAAWTNMQFTHNEELLFTLRTQVLLSAIYRRDALMDTDPGDFQYYIVQLRETRQAVERALAEYEPMASSPAERENRERLVREISEYWATLEPDRLRDPNRNPALARSFLRKEVIPKREIIIRISERIQNINRAAFQEQQAELSGIHREMRRRFLWTTILTLALACVVALLVLLYAGQLEAQIRDQHLADRRNKMDLQRLSARLVDAQEDERRKLARELHDEIGQALTALKMDLSQADRNLETPPRARKPLEEARSIADRLLHSVRDLSRLLHPSLLDDLGLPATLRWYLRGFSQRTGIGASLVEDRMGVRLRPEVELCAYRVAQEALTNIARHSGASMCRLYLQRLPHTLLLVIEDDGKGFDPAARKAGDDAGGLGLVGIQERVAQLKGTVTIESGPAKGTRISVELPASPSPAAAEADESESPRPVAATETDE